MSDRLQELQKKREQIEKHWMDMDWAEEALKNIGKEMAKIINEKMEEF